MASFAAFSDLDRHAIKAHVMREGIARYGKDFTLTFLNDAYGQPRGTVAAALRREPQSRKGKIIIAHFLNKDPRRLWPGEDWRDMIETFRPTLRKNFTPATDAKERQKSLSGSVMETAA